MSAPLVTSDPPASLAKTTEAAEIRAAAPVAALVPLAGFITLLALSVVFDSSRHLPATLALATFALTVGVCAGLANVGVAFLLAGCAFLDYNGFVLAHADGSLHWHGTPDLVRLGVLAGSALGTLLVRRALRSRSAGADSR